LGRSEHEIREHVMIIVNRKYLFIISYR
jgi:hypothetical protein